MTYHVDFEKRGGVRCGGARETQEPHLTIGRTVRKSETTKNLPAFQDLTGMFFTYFKLYLIKLVA